ncbi:protein FAM76A isoform X1 [Melitaea cinxia]|uniref:protein FAM76A isoform X1 n=1 Tax=Melitaea cinxia TaxID=113334 RepID=UPI001E270B74|nr:protein FAM76A isoform X1 [Melitaea cinxia]XP_045447145.1 protein FAM76A isoform X1 [Melitaea cinxia]
MSSASSTALFACSRCFSRHPFEELSPGEQLCKECRGSFPVVKCTYCRSEFQQTSKSNTSSICKKCEANVKAYGKPTACEYCNIIAAFIGNKCQRCANSERKYGPAVTCEQCKQRCAFDRHDDNKKVDGKLLCWLCTQSLKRALARTKQHMSAVDKHKHRSHKSKSSHKDKRKSDMMKSMNSGDLSLDSQPMEKKSKLNPLQDMYCLLGELDPNSSDHVVAMTQLKETIASLQKKVQQKDNELLSKDKLITELKAQHHNDTTELRNEMKNKERMNETKFNLMNTKIQNLLKEVATLSKSAKKNNKLTKSALANTENSGSGTDSPSTN